MDKKKTFINELDQKLSSFDHKNKELEKHKLLKNKIDLKKTWEQKIKNSQKQNTSTNNESNIQQEKNLDYFKAQELERLLQKDKKEAVVRKRSNLIKLFSLGVIIVILLISFFMIKDYLKNNKIHTDKVNVTFFNPGSVSAFEPFSLNFKIENNTGDKIENSKLTIYYPEGTLNKKLDNELISKEYKQDIDNNNSVSYKQDLTLLGLESTEKEIKYILDYKLASEKEPFQKINTYSIKINSSPLNLTFKYNSKVNSDVPTDLLIELKSNTTKDINGVSLIFDILDIFKIQSSKPIASSSNNMFYFNKIKAGETKKILLSGTFSGYPGDKKTINVKLVKNRLNDNSKILSKFMEKKMNFTIQQKDIELILKPTTFNEDGDIIFSPEVPQNLILTIKNNFKEKILDTKIKIFLDDFFFNKKKISAINGFHDSNNNFILWDRVIKKSLRSIDIASSATISAKMISTNKEQFSGIIKNPKTDIKILVESLGGTSDSKKISYENKYTIKLNSIYTFDEKKMKLDGTDITRENSTPITVGIPRKYKVRWSLSSSTNDIKSPKIEALIPHYVRVITKNNNKFNFNKTTRILTWTPETIPAFSGYNNHNPIEIDFIIEYTPTIHHVRKTIPIIKNKTVTGIDTHTKTKYKFIKTSLRTSAEIKDVTTNNKKN